MPNNQVHPADLIDRGPFSRYQKLVILLCLAIAFLDGYDALVIGYMVPTIADDWGINPGDLTPAITAGTIGLVIGALTLGAAADKRGRKVVIVLGVGLFAVFTGLHAIASGVTELSVYRLIAGIGLGAVLPSVISLSVEFSPAKNRAMVAVITSAATAAGGFVGGQLVNVIVPATNWHAMFLLGAIVPIVLLPVVIKWLPESPSVLHSHDRLEELATVLSKVSHRDIAGAEITPRERPDGPTNRVSVRDLFAENRTVATLALWAGYFCGYLMVFVVTSWMPTLLINSGIETSTAVLATSLATLGNMIGGIVLGYTVDRNKGEFWPLTIGYPLGALAMVGLVFAVPNAGLVLVMAAALGLTALGNLSGLTAAAAMVYPASTRATGVSYALTAGRFGSIVGPTLVGLLIAQNLPTKSIFLFGTIPALLASASVFVLWRSIARRTRQEAQASVRT